jgi:hypothetical protein
VSDPSQQSPIDKATVDRWQVLGGMAGVASVVITLIGAATSTFPVAVVAGVVLAVIGVALLFRWGRDQKRPRTAKRFALPVVITVVGTVLASVSATLAATPGTPSSSAVGSTDSPVTTTKATTSSSTPATTPASAPATDPAPGRTDTIHLTQYYGVDLDSEASDWGNVRYQFDSETRDFDLYFDYGNLLTSGDLAWRGKEPVDRTTCDSSTGRVRKVVLKELKEGDVYCVRTTEGRQASVTLKAKDLNENGALGKLTVEVVVWPKAEG